MWVIAPHGAPETQPLCSTRAPKGGMSEENPYKPDDGTCHSLCKSR